MNTHPHMKLFMVPTDQIRVSDSRIREDFGDIEDLADSLRRLGQIQPSVVVERNEGGNVPRYEIVAGERRLRAAKLAGLDLLCVLRDDVVEDEMRELEIEENLKIIRQPAFIRFCDSSDRQRK